MKKRFLAGMAAAVILPIACNPSSSPTGPKLTVSPTPTPAPAAGDVSGAWTGKFDPADFIGCDGNSPASASFEQTGATVHGILNAPENGCGFLDVTLEGTMKGTFLVRTVAGGGFNDGIANGYLAGATLEINLSSSCPGALCIPGGVMRLHR
jgi:hypothetical protein